MKYSKSLVSLLSLVLLASCTGGKIPSEEKPGESSALPTETPTDAPATEAVASDELTDSMLAELSTVEFNGVCEAAFNMYGYSGSQYTLTDLQLSSDSYYQALYLGTPKDSVTDPKAFDDFKKGAMSAEVFYGNKEDAVVAKALGIDNVVIEQEIEGVSWSSSFVNPFGNFASEGNFEPVEGKKYTFALAEDATDYDSIRQAFATVLMGEYTEDTDNYPLSVEIVTDGFHITEVDTIFYADPDDVLAGTSDATIGAAFKLEVATYGKDVAVKEVKPVEGTPDATLDAAISSLKNATSYAYIGQESIASTDDNGDVVLDDQGNPVYELNSQTEMVYSTGLLEQTYTDLYGSYKTGFVDTAAGIQRVTKVGSSWYVDRAPVAKYTVADQLGYFEISPLLFKLEGEGHYVLRDDLSCLYLGNTYNYSYGYNYDISDLVIDVTSSGVAFTSHGVNSQSSEAEIVDVYSQIGTAASKITIDKNALVATCDGLMAKDLMTTLDYQYLTDAAKGYGYPTALVDLIPAVPGANPTVEVYDIQASSGYLPGICTAVDNVSSSIIALERLLTVETGWSAYTDEKGAVVDGCYINSAVVNVSGVATNIVIAISDMYASHGYVTVIPMLVKASTAA